MPNDPVILVIDANAETRELLVQFLEMQGHSVHGVESGMSARATLGQLVPIAVVLDVALPDMEPLNLVREFSGNPHRLPVVVLDPDPTPQSAVTYMSNGAMGYLGRPYAFSDLLRELGAALQRGAAGRDDDQSSRQQARQIAGYQILDTIARTANGYLFLVMKDNQRYAMKLVRGRSETPAERQRERRRFHRNAIIASSINHPHVVRVHDFGTDEGQQVPYLVMEYVDGVTLKEYRKQQQPGLVDAVRLLRQIVDALVALHAQEICVRTLSPRDIMVDRQGNARLLEFAFARLPGSDFTVPGEIAGAPEYIAPEIFTSNTISPQADIFSLGVLAYEFLLGKKPFYSPSIGELAHQIVSTPPLAPTRIQPDFPEPLQRILENMLRKQPDQRYASMVEIRDDLDRFLRGETVQAAPATLRQRFFSKAWR